MDSAAFVSGPAAPPCAPRLAQRISSFKAAAPSSNKTQSSRVIAPQYLLRSTASTGVRMGVASPSKVSLMELFVEPSKLAAAKTEAESLPKVALSEIDLQWVHVLSEGWAAPLKGFMREDEYVQSLHFNCIRGENGELVNQSVPIVLAVDEAKKAEIESSGNACALVDPSGSTIAILRNCEFYTHYKEERVARTFGLTDKRHPYAEKIYEAGNVLLGGDLEVFERIRYNDGLDEYRLTPKELMAEYEKRGADAVFFFQLRNPVHNGHALLMQDTRRQLLERGFKNPLLVVHQIGGAVKGDDVPLKERILQNKAVMEEGILDPESTILGIFPSPMLYAGPTEVQWHAKARMNAGCQFYIVGRDPAGMKHPEHGEDMYDPWHGKKALTYAPGLEKLEILPFRVAAYDKSVGKMAFFDPSRAGDFLFISGSKMRAYARDGEMPPAGFMGEKAWKILVDYYASL